MTYIFVDFEGYKYWIEVNEEGTALRQVTIDENNIISISCLVPCLADQYVDTENDCEIINKDNNVFTYIHEKTTPIKRENTDLIYSLDYNPKMNYNRNIFQAHNEITKKVRSFYILDKVYYQDNNVGNTIANYLKACKGGL